MRVRVIDKIRQYINEGIESGHFRKGSRLPSYNKLKDKFCTSYATVSLAMSKLEAEGLINIEKGTGTFIAGGTPLVIKFYCLEATLDFVSYKKLIQKHLRKNDISIEIEFEDRSKLDFKCLTENRNRNYKAILVENSTSPNYPNINSKRVHLHNELDTWDDLSELYMGFSVPFYSFSYQMGVNLKIMRDIGIDPKVFDGNLLWWDRYVDLCQKNGLPPAEFSWGKAGKWLASKTLGLFFSQKINETNSEESVFEQKLPYFETSAGRRVLEIIKSCEFTEGKNGFYENRSAVNFFQGSWIAVQNGNRTGIEVDDLEIIPYQHGNRKICYTSTTFLQCYMPSSISPEERLRLWELQKIISSKEFQKDFCSLTGALSTRSDLKPEDYGWFDEKVSGFIPQKNDIVINDNIFSSNMIAYMTGIMEQYFFYDADIDNVLKCLDAKISQ